MKKVLHDVTRNVYGELVLTTTEGKTFKVDIENTDDWTLERLRNIIQEELSRRKE